MTINRIEKQDGNIKSKRRMIPGWRETFRSRLETIKNSLTVGDRELDITVITDDEIEVTQKSSFGEKPMSVFLKKADINAHDIQSPKSWRGRTVHFEWEPSRIMISPEQEKAIKELIADGTYSAEDAQAVRENMIYEIQKQRGTV